MGARWRRSAQHTTLVARMRLLTQAKQGRATTQASSSNSPTSSSEHPAAHRRVSSLLMAAVAAGKSAWPPLIRIQGCSSTWGGWAGGRVGGGVI